MKAILICAISLSLGGWSARAETLDEAVGRFLAGGTLSQEELDSITDKQGMGPAVDGKRNNGTTYLHLVKRSIVDPARDGGWPLRWHQVDEERGQAKTYRELKAIYEKQKTPVVAYALVCPAMFVNDFDLLPELIAKIAENKPLKAHFDRVYARSWKPRLDPDF